MFKEEPQGKVQMGSQVCFLPLNAAEAGAERKYTRALHLAVSLSNSRLSVLHQEMIIIIK